MERTDGLFEVRCAQCERRDGDPAPIGIGVPVANRQEADLMKQNHERATARRRSR